MSEIIRYLTHELKKLQVPTLTGVEVTREMVIEKNPDAVIMATGSRPQDKTGSRGVWPPVGSQRLGGD